MHSNTVTFEKQYFALANSYYVSSCLILDTWYYIAIFLWIHVAQAGGSGTAGIYDTVVPPLRFIL